jgi:hypothetical protein
MPTAARSCPRGASGGVERMAPMRGSVEEVKWSERRKASRWRVKGKPHRIATAISGGAGVSRRRQNRSATARVPG